MALLRTAVMLGAIATVHGANGFLVSDGGWAFDFALIGGLLALALEGPGAWAPGEVTRADTARGAAYLAEPGCGTRGRAA